MSESQVDPVIRRRPEVSLQEVGNEAILHDRRLGRAHVINASAARAWELCEGRTVDELVTGFAASYGQPPERVRADVERLLASFRQMDLLE